MQKREQEILLPIGTRGEVTTLQELSDLGVSIHQHTPSRLEKHEISGEDIRYRKMAAEVLKRGTASGKDDFFLDLAYEGLRIRDVNGRYTKYSKVFRYEGFTEAIVKDKKINLDPDTLRKLLRTVRADLVYEGFSIDPTVNKVFKSVVEQYLSDSLSGKTNDKPQVAQRIDIGWGGTIRGFYGSLYNQPESKSSSWLPYEVEFLSSYFENRIENGSMLSTLDRFILEDGVNRVPVEETQNRISRFTKIPTGSQNDITEYRHLLIYGEPRRAYLTTL